MKFTHLHVHSHYSLLDGLAKIGELVGRCKELGMDSLALTDHGALYGAIEFYQKALKAGIKPIIGAEMYVAYEGMGDKRPGIDDKRYHLTLLAKNLEGYHNLVKLVTKSHLEGFYYKPRIDKNLLRQHSAGLIGLSGCFTGEISRAVENKKPELAERLIGEYQDILGKENFYLEIMPHFNFENQRRTNEALATLSQKTGAKLVATNDIHYVRPEDAEAQDILVSVQTGNIVSEENRLTMKEANLSMRSPEEMAALFPDHPEAIAATQEIAEKVNIEIPLGSWTFPNFKVPGGTTHDEELRRLTYAGITDRGLEKTPEIEQRLRYELEIIKDKGFSPYF
ncbi:MAG: PHP domain-containing protein, partial [Candidatus Sungbacteria bacterium]|nr:PHP domain-containing protein [Candidatus Sungbacteria bacterium]